MAAKPKQKHPLDFRSFADYISRVGATELNFRSYMVRTYNGKPGKRHYYTEQCIITLEEDGTVKCNRAEFKPNEEEAKAIQRDLADANFPKPIAAKDTKVLETMIGSGSVLYTFRNDADDIIMCQERFELDNGDKKYVPWTLFDDGEWRRMEPSKLLPLWRPRVVAREARPRSKLMIHEGAKAASAVSHLVETPELLALHPWGKELDEFEHWGMIGGAMAQGRTDYGMIKKFAPELVVYVCDNDQPGHEALQKVAEHYKRKMRGIRFTDDFKEGFDLADPFPKSLFIKDRYIGPSFRSCMVPATWATEIKPAVKEPGEDEKKKKKGPPVYQLTEHFKEEWYHCVSPEVYMEIEKPDIRLNADEFNSFVRPFSAVDDTAKLFRREGAQKAAVLQYAPNKPPGVYTDQHSFERYINTFRPTDIRSEKGDVKPWLDFMDRLIVDGSDRHELLKWCATLVAAPHIRMLYGVLLISETQGVGKGTLGEKILAPLVGFKNCSFPSEREIVDSNYNYWLAHKRLAIVHEVYQGHSAKGYNQLKNVITDRNVTVSQKYLPNYMIENWIHVIAMSNSRRALQITDDDRRWLVPKVSEEKQPEKYWKDLNEWLQFDGGLGKILYWAKEYIDWHKPVVQGAAAPMTKAKRDVIEEGLSQGQRLVMDVLRQLQREREEKGDNTPLLIADTELVNLIMDNLYEGKRNDKLEKPLTVRKVAKSLGFYIGEKRAHIPKWGTHINGPRLICTHYADAETDPRQLASEGRHLFDIRKFANANLKEGAM